ncbi:MAG: hypothetical protein ABEJ35_00620 [Halobacteriaceae archaeon]
MSQTTTTGPKNTVGTVTGFKVAMLSLIGMMIATLALRNVALVYMMVLVPSVVGVLTGTVVGSLGVTAEDGLSRPALVGIAVLADAIGVAVVLLFL